MRSLFPGHYRPSAEALLTLWEQATVVVDTNSLLNLYRYRSDAREDLFAVFEALRERIWIPYQVALEFHRRRLDVISEQKSAFDSALITINQSVGAISKVFDSRARNPHSNENIDAALSEIDASAAKIRAELQIQGSKHLSVGDEDPVLCRIEALISTNVGAPPTLEAVADYCEKGAVRYPAKIPPGFSDHAKGETYFDRGVAYEAKYGDLILWLQIVEHARVSGLKSLIFITDDNKPDWWSIKEGKTLGPHPSLVEEMYREGGVESFYMYTSEQFLRIAAERGDSTVKPESIEQVHEANRAARTDDPESTSAKVTSATSGRSRSAALKHALERHEGYVATADGPEFLLSGPEGEIDFRIRVMRFAKWVSKGSLRRIRDVADELIHRTSDTWEIPELYIIVDHNNLPSFVDSADEMTTDFTRINIFVGTVNSEGEFVAGAFI